MNTFTTPNLFRWDRIIRIVVAVALLAPAFIIGHGPVIGLALLAPYFAATAMMKWDPLYGLINVLLSPFTNKPVEGTLPTPAMSS